MSLTASTSGRAHAAVADELYRQLAERRVAHTDDERDEAIRDIQDALITLRAAGLQARAVGVDGFTLARRLRINLAAFCDLLSSPGLREHPPAATTAVQRDRPASRGPVMAQL